MDMERDRLIELITKSQLSVNSRKLADYLLANGVIVPLCNVGDTVYRVDTEEQNIWIFIEYSSPKKKRNSFYQNSLIKNMVKLQD